MQTLYLWRWHLPDLKGKLKPSRWRMTEDEAHARHPGCTKVEGSLEVRQHDSDTGHSMDAGLVRRSDGAMMQPQFLNAADAGSGTVLGATLGATAQHRIA